MTVIGLSDFLKKKLDRCYQVKSPITAFSNKRIAVDANLWISQNFKTAAKDIIYRLTDFYDIEGDKIVLKDVNHNAILRKLSEMLVKFLLMWVTHSVTPVMVWDGPARKEKSFAHKKRAKQEDDGKRRLEEALESLKTASIKDTPILTKKVRDLLYQNYPISKADIFYIKDFCAYSGMPCIDAPRDAEFTCAMLSRHGYVEAVWSNDSDCYPLLAKCMIVEYSHTQNEIPHFLLSYPEIALDKLELTPSQFIDFCILCGVDFNEKINNIGPVKAYKLIKEHSCLENIEFKTNMDLTSLNYTKCRKIFKPPFFELPEDIFTIDVECLKDAHGLFQQYSCSHLYKQLVEKCETVVEELD